MKREGYERSRYIPSSVREHLLEHAGYRCEFRGPGGVRCTARTRLEVDHPIPGRGRVALRGEPSGFLPGAQSSRRRAGVRGGVHEREDQGRKSAQSGGCVKSAGRVSPLPMCGSFEFRRRKLW